jgi:hypothetical protein
MKRRSFLGLMVGALSTPFIPQIPVGKNGFYNNLIMVDDEKYKKWKGKDKFGKIGYQLTTFDNIDIDYYKREALLETYSIVLFNKN